MVGKKQLTRKDVAKLADVSVATVSYVVNDGPRPVAAETRAKVEAAIRKLGYYPNELARSLSTKTTAVIGLITPTLTNPFYAEVAQSLENVCSAEGYLVLWSSTGRDLARELELPKILRAKQVDGVVMIPSEAPTKAIAPLLQGHIPTVVLEHCLEDVHCIVVDELQGGLIATQHLLALGQRRIAMLKHEPSSQLSYLRADGHCRALEEAGVSLDPDLVVVSKAGQAGGFEAMQKLLALPHPPPRPFLPTTTCWPGERRMPFMPPV
jgi:LacI family transcriptional regulator